MYSYEYALVVYNNKPFSTHVLSVSLSSLNSLSQFLSSIFTLHLVLTWHVTCSRSANLVMKKTYSYYLSHPHVINILPLETCFPREKEHHTSPSHMFIKLLIALVTIQSISLRNDN